jgi:DNA-binding IclR family transcriptional regulator
MNPLQKIFIILEIVVSNQAKGATYSDILATSNLPKSTVHRIIKDLAEIGYITFNAETKRYYGSLRLAWLGAEVMANFQLRKHIRPFLLDLHRDTEHTSNLGILDGFTGVFLDKIEAKDFGIKLFSEIGKTFPLHCTGLGKVLLAYSPATVLEKVLQHPLEAITEKTITTPDRLKKELALVRECGYALDNEEITRGIQCVAAPIFGFEDKLEAAISIAFPAYIEADRGIDREIRLIKEYSDKISESLGNKNRPEKKTLR